MKITSIDYARLLPLGQYENERIALHADVDETDNIIDVFKDLKATVFQLHEEGKLLEESKKVVESEKQNLDTGHAQKPTLDEIGSLRYVDKTSDKGPYKTASKTDNPNNLAFLKLQKYLEDHKGFAILHGFKLWQFSNNPDILARRKQ